MRLKRGLILKRLLAFILDMLLLNFIVVAPFEPILSYGVGQNLLNPPSYLYPATFIMIMFIFVYFVVLEYAIGQTVGKIILNLKVVTENRLKFWQCVVRSLFLVPILPFSLLVVVDPVYLIFKGQRFSEYLSGTNVIQGD